MRTFPEEPNLIDQSGQKLFYDIGKLVCLKIRKDSTVKIRISGYEKELIRDFRSENS